MTDLRSELEQVIAEIEAQLTTLREEQPTGCDGFVTATWADGRSERECVWCHRKKPPHDEDCIGPKHETALVLLESVRDRLSAILQRSPQEMKEQP